MTSSPDTTFSSPGNVTKIDYKGYFNTYLQLLINGVAQNIPAITKAVSTFNNVIFGKRQSKALPASSPVSADSESAEAVLAHLIAGAQALTVSIPGQETADLGASELSEVAESKYILFIKFNYLLITLTKLPLMLRVRQVRRGVHEALVAVDEGAAREGREVRHRREGLVPGLWILVMNQMRKRSVFDVSLVIVYFAYFLHSVSVWN